MAAKDDVTLALCQVCGKGSESYVIVPSDNTLICDGCVDEMRAALQKVKAWCELNNHQGSVIYIPVCAALGN